jgi:phosphoribosylanthranilate isomerase
MHLKICGITNLDDARVAVAAGADLLGFILYAKSPRYVAPAMVKEIIAALRVVTEPPISTLHSPISALRFVGVFVNTPLDQVTQTLGDADLDYAQLHGDEPPEMVAALAGRAYKAIRPTTTEDALRLAELYAPLGVEAGPHLMIDAFDPAAYGGTGQRADWRAAAEVAHLVPGLLLAGGLTPDNVTAAIDTVQPWGVDVSSGVEIAPGRKDARAIGTFARRVRCT